MNFSLIKKIVIPEGNVKQIEDSNNIIIWQKQSSSFKAILTLSDHSVVNIPENGDSTLTQNELSAYSATCISVEILSSVTSIGESAFRDCSGLTEVTIGSGVTSIGGSAFQFCSSLTEVTIPDSVTSIGSDAFNGCSGLTEVIIPDSVTSIGSGTFNGCSGLTEVTIGTGVTSIESYTFTDCTSLSSVTIGSGVTSIGGYAFYICSVLTEVVIPDSVTSIGGNAFNYCTSLSSVTIGSGVTSIGASAFRNCTSLSSVTIPDSVTSIGNYAFRGCTSLSSITSNAITAPTISSATFRDVATGGTLTYPDGSDYSQWLSTSAYYLGYYHWHAGGGGGGGLPNVTFLINYNAKQYDSVNNKLPKTAGQLADTDAVFSGYSSPTFSTDHLTINSNQRIVISGFTSLFNRSSSTPVLTVIAKAKTTGHPHLLANRDKVTNSSVDLYNWMFRWYNNRITLHGSSEQGSISVNSNSADIASVRVNSNLLATYNNWTQSTSSTYSNFDYGNQSTGNQGDVGLFNGYGHYSNSPEPYSGDFYWIYVSTEYLTDSQIQDVINYNENL